MEFQEGLMRLMIHKPTPNNWVFERDTENDKKASEYTNNTRRKWRLFHRSSPAIPSNPNTKPLKIETPKEFLCPISGSLMADPVIVTSGQTFESACVKVCKKWGFTPILKDEPTPDFSSVIPNLALKSTIVNWCKNFNLNPPETMDLDSAQKLIGTLKATQKQKTITQNKSDEELIQGVAENPKVTFNHAATELTRRQTDFYSSSEESINAIVSSSTPPLPLATRPSCYSSPSSSELETLNPNMSEEEEILTKLQSPQIFDIEAGLISLRNVTRTREDSRVQLCSPRLLSVLRSLIVSRYPGIQVNSVAALVNLSLEKGNKLKIVRSGIVPNLIDVLKGGSPEVQEHASGALFSLALDDDNKMAIGVLGALPPLIRMLRSQSERTRHDSALALYHLSLVQSNRSKLVKLGSIPVFLGMVRFGHMTGRVLLILCNLASCVDGRAALLDAGAVCCLVEMLRGNEWDTESTRESCVAVLYGLSQGGLRFKGLAIAAGAVDMLMKAEKMGPERAREKVKRMLELMKRRDKEEEEEVDWEELLDEGFGSQIRCGARDAWGGPLANSSEF